MRNRILPGLLLALLALPAAASPADWLQALRAGGLVVFLRHAETGPPHPDQGQAVLGDCATQRNLTEAGRAQARAIGEAMRALAVPVGRVLASPYCRTLETAALAFGDGAPEMALALPRHVDAAAHRAMGQALRDLIARAAPASEAGNLILVGHSYHLIAAGGPPPEPQGAAAILHPDGEGGFRTLALLPPQAWADLARMAARPDRHAAVADGSPAGAALRGAGAAAGAAPDRTGLAAFR
ncbi:histidine phosphatase family protein [Paracraurococcus ruber]|nr:histidine phosphatase family protein [Paracraurococcus ruber]